MKKQKQRKQHLSKQVLSLILSAAMIFTLPAATYAVEDTSTDSGLCFRPLYPVLENKMYIIWKKYQVFTPIAELLIQALLEKAG